MTPNSPDRPPVKPRERSAILQCLAAGVVPRIGLQHIQVGRLLEVEALLRDLSIVREGGASMRFVIGPYGSGKTFYLETARNLALEQRLVTVNADLNPQRRISASDGSARSLYQELLRNAATRGKPDGGALASVVERWIAEAQLPAEPTLAQVRQQLKPLEDLISGFDFAAVLTRYAVAHAHGDEATKSNALRWMRGEYATRTEARQDLGVRTIIDDASVFDHLKLMAAFVRLSGFSGLLVILDEAVNLFKLRSVEARERNYESLLRMLNDCLQGSASGLMILVGGTPEFLRDPRKGLYSYGALKTRLAENRFATDIRRDLSGPVIELQNLCQEELLVLLRNVRRVHASPANENTFLPNEGTQAFMDNCASRLGSNYFTTPRQAIKDYMGLLNLLEQHRDWDWRQALGVVSEQSKAHGMPPAANIKPNGTSDPEVTDDLVNFALGNP